jgi:hypothetical protein
MRPLPSLRPPLCRGELRKDFQLAKTADFEMAIDTARCSALHRVGVSPPRIRGSRRRRASAHNWAVVT